MRHRIRIVSPLGRFGLGRFDQCYEISRVGLGRWVVSATFLGESIRPCVVSAKVYGNPRGGWGGGGTRKFSVYIGEADFFGVKILNFRIWVFRKKLVIFSSPEPKAYSMVVEPASVRPSVRASVHNFNLEYL